MASLASKTGPNFPKGKKKSVNFKQWLVVVGIEKWKIFKNFSQESPGIFQESKKNIFFFAEM
jgi:hypothetical protein